MAQHRNVRGCDCDEDLEDDDHHGQSVEDDSCISPSTAAQFIYSQRDKPSVEPIEEYDHEDLKESFSYVSNHQLSGFNQARFYSCLDHMREVFVRGSGTRYIYRKDSKSSYPQSANHLDYSSKPFDFSSSVGKYGLSHSSSVPSHCLLHRKKKLDRLKSEKKPESCRLTKELSLANLIPDMSRDSCESQPSVRLSSTDSLESLLSKNLDADLLRLHPSECASKDDSAFKEILYLKSIMIKSTTLNNSLYIQIQDSLGSSDNPLCLTSLLENMTVDNLNASKETEVGSVSLVEQSFSQCESPSLTELFREHKENNISHFTDLSLGSFPLSQLANHCQSSPGISELTGSVLSLAFPKASPTRDLENLSLSELIAETIDVYNSQIKKESFEVSLSEVRSPGIDSNIDLRPIVDQSIAPSSQTKVLSSKLGKKSNFAKDNEKNNKGCQTRKPPFSLSQTKALAARPSAFASTLYLRYPLKSCKPCTLDLYKTFLYSRQVQDVKDKEISPLVEIIPFDFKSASPDDIVKAN
uniref:Uncharacterized protein n=1 Tax=Pan troglodytes TaxID=9598 RepID=A0A2I3RHC6_PANTR